MKRNVFGLISIIAVISAVLLSGCIGSQTPMGEFSGIMTPWGPLTAGDAEGKDLGCIGRYKGMIRFSYSEDVYEDDSKSISIDYYIKGDKFEDVKSYFASKAEECGYEKMHESTGSLSTPGYKVLHGYEGDYQKLEKDAEEDLYLNIYTLQIGDKTVTVAEIRYDFYPREEVEESSSNSENMENQQQTQVKEMTADDWKELFESVVKTSFNDYNITTEMYPSDGAYLVFRVSRDITENDVTNIKNAIINEGYNVFVSGREGNTYTVSFTDNAQKYMISFQATVGTREISFSAYS